MIQVPTKMAEKELQEVEKKGTIPWKKVKELAGL